MLVLAFFIRNRPHDPLSPSILALEFSITISMILLVSPITWWHYLVWLIVPISAVFYQNVYLKLSPVHRWRSMINDGSGYSSD
jgi:hypothetical protein